MLNLFLLLGLVSRSTESASISGISTLQGVTNQGYLTGSFMGGTSLYFHSPDFNPDLTIYTVTIGGQNCPTVSFTSGGSTLECIVPALSPTNLFPISVAILVTSKDSNEVISSSASTLFNYSYETTPWILFVNPTEACPGDEIAFVGRWGTTDTSLIVQAKIKQQQLTILDPYPSLSYWGWYNVSAVINGNVHGDTTPSIQLSSGLGISAQVWIGTQYSSEGAPFDFRTLARIDSISHNVGSSAGGLGITITGAGFPADTTTSFSLYDIQTDSTACTVTQVTPTSIQCTTTAKPSPSSDPVFPGNAGLVREYWSDTSGVTFSELIDIVTPDSTTYIATPQIKLDEDVNFKDRMYGLFVPPVTGNYYFYVSSDDSAQVYLSSDNTKANMVKIIDFGSYTELKGVFAYISQAASAAQYLQAGYQYYIEARHTQGGGSSHFELGVETPGPSSGAVPANPKPFVQRINVTPTNILREVQLLTIGGSLPTGGTLTLKYGPTTLKDIAWNTITNKWECGDIVTQLNKLGLGGFSCAFSSDASNFYYNITFNFPRSSSRQLIYVFTNNMFPSGLQGTTTKYAGTIALSGNFTITYNGQVSKTITINDWIRGTERDMNVNMTVLNSQLVLQGYANGDAIDYYFILPAGLVPASLPSFYITSFDSILGGQLETSTSTSSLVNTTTLVSQPGTTAYYPVIPSDFLRTYQSLPQLTVDIQGTRAVCRGDCSFVYMPPPIYPEITAFTPGPTANYPTPVTITGVLFDTTPGNTQVFIGFVSCIITSITATEIVVTMPLPGTTALDGTAGPIGVAGAYTPVVVIANKGQVSTSVSDTVNIAVTISEVLPAVGSTQGGTILTITGSGFLDTLSNTATTQTIDIGGSACTVLTTSVTAVTCLTSAQTGDNTLTITVGSEFQTSTDFSYDASSTPTVSALSATFGSTFTVTQLTITGSGFGTSAAAVSVLLHSASLGDFRCALTSVADTEIDCNIHGGLDGDYALIVSVSNYGYAEFSSISNLFSLEFQITAVSPAAGSTNGGTLLTITGKGFSLITENMLVYIDTSDQACEIQSITSTTSLTCLTPPQGAKSAGTTYNVGLLGRLVNLANCNGSCSFQYEATSTPTVTSISPLSGKAGDSLTVTGSNFGSDTASVHILFGDIEADATLDSDTSISVTVPSSQGVSVPITMSIDGLGTATCEFTFTNAVVVTMISPMEVSKGGANIVITGSGFDSGMVLAFGSTPCTILGITDTTVTCKVAGYSTNETPQKLAITGSGTFSCTNDAVCSVAFTAAKTISISSLSGNLAITGSFQATTDASLVTVSLTQTSGVYECTVTSVTSTTINCTPNAPGGSYTVSVHICGYGYAASTLSYSLTLGVTAITAPNSSFNGGLLLELTGTGLYSTTVVKVCGFPCAYSSTTGKDFYCTLPPVPTTYSQSAFKVVTVASQLVTSGSSTNSKAFDGDITSYYNVNANTILNLVVDVGSGYLFTLSKISFIGGGTSQSNYMNLVGISLQGSSDNSTWTTIHTFTFVNNFWNRWVVPPTQATPIVYRFYQLYLPASTHTYQINEFQLHGILSLDSSLTSITCSVTVAASSTATPISSPSTLVNYQGPLTAYISGLSPARGTSAGGDTISFTGSGFGASTSNSAVIVTIDGINCPVSLVTNTLITCVTGARENHVVPSLEVFIEGSGYVSTQGIVFLYSELWSDPATWGGELPPIDGQLVVIPPGMTVVLDIATNILAGILIEGNLIVKDVAGITIDAYYIFVYGGMLQIGTESEPFTNIITITLHGNTHTRAIPNYGSKFIAVRNGVLDIHGEPRTPSWTILDQTANAGDYTIHLQESVNWKPTEKVVVATTSYVLEESEVMEISSVSASGTEITFTTPLQYQHYAATETYGSSTIDIRGEVGLLTRNIRITGTIDPVDTMFGVHIMLFSPGDESSVGRVENLELHHAGQAYNLGRYPLHFHLIGAVTQSYIRNNAIHNTFNRATTVHGVLYLTIENNVAYENMGHAYFIEDGIETQNTFSHNLGVNTRASYSLLNFDQTPATFWITHPTNFVLNNHAAGSESYGFWFSMTLNPTGPSSTPLVFPEFNALGLFQDNTAHSVHKYGLRIFHRWFPSLFSAPGISDHNKPDWWNVANTPVTANLERFTAWKCMFNGAIGEDLGDIRFIDFKLADNILAGIELTYTHWTQWFQTTRVQNALIIGNSGNSEGACSGSIGLLGSQTDGLFIDGAHFYNFDSTQFPLGQMSHSFKTPTRDMGARYMKLQNLSFTNSVKLINWGFPATGFFEILDNTLNGNTGIFVAAFLTHLQTDQCVADLATYNAIVCAPGQKIRRVGFYGQSPFAIFNFLPAEILRLDGTDIPFTPVTDDNGVVTNEPTWSQIKMQKGGKNKSPNRTWNIPFVTNHTYNVHWDNSPVDWTTLQIEQDTFDGGEYVMLVLNFTDHRENFTVTQDTLPSGTVTSVAKTSALVPDDPSGTFIWDNTTSPGTFNITISGKPITNQFGDISITAYRCYGTHCSTVTNYTESTGPVTVYYWSNISTWSGGVLPQKGSYVQIPTDWHLYLDVITPVLHQIEINGVLEFMPNMTAELHANWIFVRAGSIVSGSPTTPTPNNITHSIVLHGLPTDPSFAFNPDVQGGNKVLVVTGNLSMYGYPKITTSYLEQNVRPGENVIFVTGVDWQVGDEIAIAPSGYNTTEYEVFTIASISGVIANYDQVQAGTTVNPVDFSADSDWTYSNSFRNYGKDRTVQDPNQVVLPPAAVVTKITLSSPLSFFHTGVTVNIANNIIDLRTEVALITRNVKITTDGNGWQATTIVNDFMDYFVLGDPVFRTGFVNLDYVQFDGCGQFDTGLACLRFESVNTDHSTVYDCSFKNPGTWALYLNNASYIDFSDNVIVNARWRAVVALSMQSVILNNNMIIRISQRDYTQNILDAAAGFHVCSDFTVACTFEMNGNRVYGADFAGYIMSAGPCGGTGIVSTGNRVRSAFIGFLLTNSGDFGCIAISSYIVHFSQEGLGFKSNTNQFQLSGLEFVDNKLGMTMRVGRGNDHTTVSANLTNSVFVGKTIYSMCQNCQTDLECGQRIGYMFGDSDVGGLQVTLIAKIKIPLSKQQGESNLLGWQTVTNSVFLNFNYDATCQFKSFAISSNDHSPDYQLPQYMSGIKFSNVGTENRVFMNDPDSSWLNPDDCVNWNCTGPLNAFLYDIDGSITNFPNGGYVLPNNPGIAKKDICTLHPLMNSYFCSKATSDLDHYVMLQFESFDPDNTTRTFSPINITTYPSSITPTLTTWFGPAYRNDIANYQDHTWDGFYTGHIRWSRFPSVIYTGQYYNISTTGTPPNSYLFQLQLTQNLDRPIIVSLRNIDPSIWTVTNFATGALIPSLQLLPNGTFPECRFSDSHGVNRWFSNVNTLQFVLRSEVPLLLQKISSVVISLEMDMSIDTFYSSGPASFVNAFAAILGIPSYRITIAGIRLGSVIADMNIAADSSLGTVPGTTTAAQLADLTSLASKVNILYTSGQLATALNVVIMNVVADVDLVTSSTSTSTGSGSSSGGSSGGDTGDNSGGFTGNGINPTGENQGGSKGNKNSFEVVAEDWVIALFAGIIFLLIIVSGLIIYQQNKFKNIQLHDVSPSKIGVMIDHGFDPAPERAWAAEEHKSPSDQAFVSRQSFIDEAKKKDDVASFGIDLIPANES